MPGKVFVMRRTLAALALSTTALMVLGAKSVTPQTDSSDFFQFSLSWMSPATPASQRWDLHDDDVIDEYDLSLLIGRFHQPGSEPSPTPSPSPTPQVPSMAGTWVGEFRETSGVPDVPDYGAIIAEVNQAGSALEIIMRPDNVTWTGVLEGADLTASGADHLGYPTSIEGTLSDDTVTGTYSGRNDDTGATWSGTFQLHRPGPRIDLAGIWLLDWADESDSDDQLTHGVRLTDITQTDNLITVEALADGNGGNGYVEGNVLLFRVGPLVEGGAVVDGLYDGSYVWDDGFSSSWGITSAQRYVPGTTVNAAGDWTIDFTEIYSDKASPKPSQVFYATITQQGNNMTLNATGFGTFTGQIYGDRFVTWGTSVEGDDVRIDGIVSGSAVEGTGEGEGYNPWWWGTYTGYRN